jgi:hypothetical protein
LRENEDTQNNQEENGCKHTGQNGLSVQTSELLMDSSSPQNMAVASKIGFGRSFDGSVRFASKNCAKRYRMECRRLLNWRSIDSQQLVFQARTASYGLVDALGQVRHIVIPCADQDAGVHRHETVQFDEVTAVERQNRPVARDGEGQNAGIRDALIALTGFLGCQDVMTKLPQFFDDRKREVFVTVQPRHPLCFLVFLDCSVDLFRVRPVI